MKLRLAQLARDRPENAGAARIQIFVDDDDGVVVEAQQRTVSALDRLSRANENRPNDFAFLYCAGGARFLHVRGDHVADPGRLSVPLPITPIIVAMRAPLLSATSSLDLN